ncbi:MAG: hypothetical protein JXQ84_07595 [Rhodospirillaceae bacterium]|nr:hypothetical protein [Rhodospirillaceae bacterium]
MDPPYGLRFAQPPSGTWSEVEWSDIARIELKFPKEGTDYLVVPDNSLLSVYLAVRRNLERACEKIREQKLGEFYTCRKTFYPETGINHDDFYTDVERHVFWFAKLLDRMAKNHPERLRRDIATWPGPDRPVFDKLRLYAWNRPGLFTPEAVVQFVVALENSCFWDHESERELLFLLRDFWSRFSSSQREQIVARILDGPDKYESEKAKEYSRRKALCSAVVMKWLVNADCKMSDDVMGRYEALKSDIPDWDDSWVDDVATENVSRGRVSINTDASVFDHTPTGQLFEVATRNTGHQVGETTDRRPFVGLVKNQPSRAILALCVSARRGDFPAKFWGNIIEHWPENASKRATYLLCKRMRAFPSNVMTPRIGIAIGMWIEKHLVKIAEQDEVYALELFDDILSGLLSDGTKEIQSALGQVRIGGTVTEPSRRTIDLAMNSPIGKAMSALLSVLALRSFEERQGLPKEFISRIEALLTAPGEGSDHAICSLTYHIDWLNGIDPDWVSERIIPWFDVENPASEPAWSGRFDNPKMPVSPLFAQMKPSFIRLFPKMYDWKWGEGAENQAPEWVVMAFVESIKGNPGLTAEETRDCVRMMSPRGRQHIIWFLGHAFSEEKSEWKEYSLTFIREAWPKERKFQTEATSRAWVSTLGNAGEKFPDALRAAKDFLRPIRSSNLSLLKFIKENGGAEPVTTMYPKEVLDLLNIVLSDSSQVFPYGLPQLMDLLASAEPRIVSTPPYVRLSRLTSSV